MQNGQMDCVIYIVHLGLKIINVIVWVQVQGMSLCTEKLFLSFLTSRLVQYDIFGCRHISFDLFLLVINLAWSLYQKKMLDIVIIHSVTQYIIYSFFIYRIIHDIMLQCYQFGSKRINFSSIFYGNFTLQYSYSYNFYITIIVFLF